MCGGGGGSPLAGGTNLSTEKTRAIFPMARILLRITSFRAEAVAPAGAEGRC